MKKPKKKKVVAKKAKSLAKSPAKAKTTISKKSGIGQPYGDRVLVKPAQAEKVTSFGIALPTDSKEKPERGVVVAVGAGKKTDDGRTMPLNVKVGDTIMFSKYGYDEVTINGTEYYLIREDSITFIF